MLLPQVHDSINFDVSKCPVLDVGFNGAGNYVIRSFTLPQAGRVFAGGEDRRDAGQGNGRVALGKPSRSAQTGT